MSSIGTPGWRILPRSMSGMLWLGIVLALVLAAVLFADERLLNKQVQQGIGNEPFKLFLQFLLVTVAGGAVFALINVRKDEEARREARTKAIQSLGRELSEAYRSMKQSRRRLRSRLIRGSPYRLHSKEDDFETCMDELLAAQVSLEEVEDNIETSSALFGTEQFTRITAALHYAVRYLHDVFEDFEKGRVEREEDRYVIAERCKNLRDFLGEPKDDEDFCGSVKELYDRYKEKGQPLETRHAVLLEIDSLRNRRKSERRDYRYRKIAFQCIRSAFLELRIASTGSPAL